jgi:hypothetical protein
MLIKYIQIKVSAKEVLIFQKIIIKIFKIHKIIMPKITSIILQTHYKTLNAHRIKTINLKTIIISNTIIKSIKMNISNNILMITNLKIINYHKSECKLSKKKFKKFINY